MNAAKRESGSPDLTLVPQDGLKGSKSHVQLLSAGTSSEPLLLLFAPCNV